MLHSVFSKAPGASEVDRTGIISIPTMGEMKPMLRKAEQGDRAT